MIECPIYTQSTLHPKEIAIYDTDRSYTYKELDALIHANQNASSIFVADPNISSIIQIFSLLRRGKRIFPLSPREPTIPNPSLPGGQGTCLMTSGSTGEAKFALHSLKAHYANALYSHSDLHLSPGCRWKLSLPLNHVGGLAILFRCFLKGAAVILPKASHIEPTHLSLVPTQLKRLLSEKKPFLSIQAILVGGAPIPFSICEEGHRAGLPLFLTYGMTEMASQIATHRFDPKEGIHFGSSLPKRELRIDTNGEIWVRGETLFEGYLSLPSPFTDGWFPTKDLGKIENDQLYIVGRKDRMIISGGENIHLEEIERALLALPGVKSVSVGKRFDEEFGERPTATLWINQEMEKEKIRQSLEKSLPRYKIPYLEDLFLHRYQEPMENLSKRFWN